MAFEFLQTPWKLALELERWLLLPAARLRFTAAGIGWGRDWRLYGIPIIQKHRQSIIRIGSGLQLRSSVRSNPLTPYHPVVLTTRRAGALLQVGEEFAMTGGVLCAACRILVGDRVTIGANCTVTDTDFHPLDAGTRRRQPNEGGCKPVTIEDDVFIGMNCIILKGVTIGAGSVIGAGSIVTGDIPPRAVAAGNPARVIRERGL